MITLLAQCLKALNSNDSPNQIAIAIVIAAFMGITPLLSPHNLILLSVLLLFRINLTMFLLAFGLFTLIAYLLDPISHTIGLSLLHAEALQSFWLQLYNSHFWRLMAYNNTLVLGSVVLCSAISIPLFFISRIIVVRYRQHILSWVQKTRLARWLQGGKLLSIYQGLSR